MSKSKFYTYMDLIPIKSKFEADIIRFSVRAQNKMSYNDFKNLLTERHGFNSDFNYLIWYMDPVDGDLLPINNDSNFEKSLLTSPSLLRIFLQRKGENLENIETCGSLKRKGKSRTSSETSRHMFISNPHNFRQISSIIDADILPKTCRRVRLLKHKSDKPLGFYIKEGQSLRELPVSSGGGVEKVPGIFISRLISGGLAESTGLLAVNDEILEVNGITVLGKTLDQVTDMMIVNLSNLIITVRPANELTSLSTLYNDSFPYRSQSSTSSHSVRSIQSAATESDEEDIQTEVYYV